MITATLSMDEVRANALTLPVGVASTVDYLLEELELTNRGRYSTSIALAILLQDRLDRGILTPRQRDAVDAHLRGEFVDWEA